MLISLARAGASAEPEQPLLLADGVLLTYADAVDRAERVAAALVARRVDRFAIAAHDPATVLIALLASSAVGVEACVYPRQGGDIEALTSEFGHSLVIMDEPAADPGHQTLGDLDAVPIPAGSAPLADPVLVLTSGTTGRPKGTRHLWSRLVSAARPDETPGHRWLLAFNLNQFAAIQVVVHALASRATLVAAQSAQPRHAVEAMATHAVTHASATPTFWRFVAHLLDERAAGELALQQITLGGEAVPDTVLSDLRRLFPQTRISQIYASSEFGSSVSVRDDRAGLPLSVLDRSEGSDVQFRIVDGELHARSSVGMVGYFGEADLSDGWRPTGDLVEIRGDRIAFVGRTSEIINVGGVKVHPLPVEEAASTAEGVLALRAYGRANPVTGQIVALDVVMAPGEDAEEVRDRISQACRALPEAARPRRIRMVDSIEQREHKTIRTGASEPS